MSSLLFNYDKLVGGGDPSFAVDYMVERILETNAVYAEPTQEVIEKVDALANYKSPEDADDYIWEWLDGLAEEKGTFVYTLMFDQVWVSDGSSYDLYHYDISEEDEEAIKFAGSPLEENQNLKEITTINSRELEALVDRLVDKRFKYYPHDPNYDRTIYDVFLWLEKTAGDNQRAFTFYLEKNQFGKLLSVSIFVMPGEQAYHYYDPTEEDIELLQGIGDINEVYKVNWDKDLAPEDFKNPELLADALVEAGASFIDPGFFWENIAIGVDRGYLDDDDQYTDEYYEELAQALFDAYGDDKLYYTFYYDDPYETDVMLFSDGGHIIIEDDYNWTDDDFELIAGAGMLEEAKQSSEWHEGVDWDKMYSDDIADALVKADAVYVHPDKFEQDSLKADKFSPKYHLKNFGTVEPIVDLFGELYDSDTLHYTIFNDPLRQYTDKFITNRGEFWNVSPDGDDWTKEDYEMVIGAGQLNETINEDFVVDSAEDFANALAEKGARYVEIPGDKMADFQQISDKNSYDADDDVHELIYEFLKENYKTGDSLVYTYYDYDGTVHTFDGDIGDHYWVDDFKDVPYNYGIELIIGAGQLNELKESHEEELDEIELADLLDHITKNGLSVREIEGGDIDELEEIAAEYWEEDDDGDADFNDNDPGFFENLERRFSLFANEGEMVIFYTPDWYYHLPFVGKLGDDTLWTYDSIKGFQDLSPVSQENVDDILEAGSLFQENKAKEQIEEKDSRPNPHYGWDAGIMWGVEGDIEETADRLAELGAEFIEFPEELLPDIGSHTYDDDETYFQELADIFLDEYGLEPNLKYAMEENDDGDPVFIFSDGTYWVGYGISSEDVELIVNAGKLNESLADQPTYVKIEALANDVVEQDLQYYELSNDEREDLIELAAMIGDGEQPIAKWDKTIINILKKQRSKTGKEHYTVTPTMTQIQYPDQQVIDYMYFDEFLTRFLPNADKSDLELLRGAGQLNENLNEVELPSYMKGFRNEDEFRYEVLADNLAEEGAKYIDANTLDFLPDNLDTVDKDDDTVFSVSNKVTDFVEEKVREFSKKFSNDSTLKFTIWEFETEATGYRHNIFILFSDYHYIDAWATGTDDLDLIISSGQLNEIESPKGKFGNWWSKVDWNSPTKGEQLADVLASMGAEYIPEEKWNTLDKDKYLDNGDLDGYISDVAYDFKIHSYDKPHLTFSLVEIGDEVHLISSTEFTYDMWDFDNEEIDLIIGAGQLNESTKDEDEKYPKDETSVDSVASWLINNNAEYYELTYEDGKLIDKAYEEEGTASAEERAVLKILKRQKHKDIPIYTYDSTPEIFYILFNDGQYGYYYVEEFKDVPYNDVIDMLISAGQLQEQTISDYPNGSYATEVADFIADNNATYHEITSQEEEDIIQAWDDDRGDDEIEDILKRHKKPNTPVFTWIELSDQFAMLFNDGNIEFYSMYEFKDVDTHPTKGSMDEAWELITGAGKLNEETASSSPFIESDFVSAEAIADKFADLGAEWIDLDSDEIEDIENGDSDDRDYEAFKIVKYYSKRKGRPVFIYSAYDGVFHFYDENSGTHEIFYEADFRDIMGQEAIDLIIGAGQLNEESKEYVDPLASITDASKGEQLADALANAGARYIDAEWLDKIENNYVEGKYPKFQDSVEDIIDELRDEFKKEDTIIFTYFQPERVFITYDGKYYETFFMSDFDDLSGTADVRMIIDAGLINEALDLEDPKIGDMIDAYTYDIYALIDPKGHNDGNIKELSTGTMYKYGDAQNPADYYMENSWKTLPKPISDQFEDILGSSWMQDRATDFGRDAFLENNREAYHEFYGMHDEVDEDLLRDAGYEKWAEEFEQIKDDQIASFFEEDYEIRFGASIKTDFDRDPESIYVFISCDLKDFSAVEILKQVELGKVYKNISSVEALREAMKEFMYDLVPKFMAGEKPAEITTNDVYEQQKKKPLKEGVFEFEDLITNIVEWPLHYVDPPQDILDSIANEAEQYGMDMSEVETELWERLSKYLGTLDRNAGYADEEGYESDEGFFTIIDSDFWEDAGFTPNPDMYFYIDANFSDGYELTPEQYKDVIEAGKLYNNDESINENKDTLIPEDVEYNPTFEQIDEMIENATEELIDAVTRTYDTYGDPTIERLESGDGFMSFADGGFRSHESNNVSNLYGQYAMPTNEIDDALEKIYDRVFEYAHESAVEWMKKENPEVWAEFSGDPELLTYKNLYDAGEAYQDVDEERSKIYYDAAEELDQYERDSMYEDDDSMLFFEIEIQYYNANATMNDTDLPMLKFRGAVETNYKTLGAKETERTFTSEEELEEALTSGAKEIEDWFDGEERNQNRVGQLTEELSTESSLEIFEIVKSIVEDNTKYPVFENPIRGQDIDQEVGIYNYFTDEDYYIDLMKYLSNERVLPKDFQKNEEQYVEEAIWEAAEDEVLGNLDEYVPYEKRMEIKGVHYEIAELYRNGELQDIDLEFYEDLHDIIVDKKSDYMNDTGIMQHFEFTVIPEEELVTLTAKVELDPEYDGIEHKNSIEIKIESDLDEFAKKVDQATKELVSWMQGN